ncbi:hypothetical protein ACRAWD_11425 [Caulobacter segnis]
MVAELTGPLDGWARRAALAAISVHDAVQSTNNLPLIAAHAVLIMALERTAGGRGSGGLSGPFERSALEGGRGRSGPPLRDLESGRPVLGR